ncbi:MAG TPA: helix-turn-helix domain-containing protein [Thermoplasmata archaeon]|nr:helix-turn-helix domain-containing protein [Thermoplasmata archaeon]
MPLRRVTISVPVDLLVREGIVPSSFFRHNESVEILHVYAFQPRERVLLVRVVRSGPSRSIDDIMRSRERLRKKYHLRDFEILRVEDGGRAYVALLRQHNPAVLEALLEDLGAGVTPTTPTIIREEAATLSFLADEVTSKAVFGLLDSLGVGWRLRSRREIRHGAGGFEDALTGRQREILSLAWNLGYFEIPARVGLTKLSELTGLSRNTVSQHLRRGIRRLLRDSLS